MLSSSPGLTGDPAFRRRPLGTHSYYIYILTSRVGGTLYVGVTNDLIRRVYKHKSKSTEGFTEK